MTRRLLLFLALSGALAACGGDAPRAAPPPADASPPAGEPAAAPVAWRSNPAEGVQLSARDSVLMLDTGPHAVVWRADQPALAPPYTVRGTFHKRAGRLNEGYGIVFGGTGLEGPEAGQRYAYFLVRGDGSFLVKRREGAGTPVVRDWTRHAAIQRDGEEGGLPNRLEVRVGTDDVAFLVNGEEVARVPAAELPGAGRAGVRSAHDVRLEVAGFGAAAGAP